MSSTNRGAERHPNDYYFTPVKDILHFLREFEKDRQEVMACPGNELTMLDPCAGGGPGKPCAYPDAVRQFEPWWGAKIRTFDIREDSPAVTHADYLKFNLDYKPKIALSNPPFYLAQEFIDKCLADVEPGGLVIMLCRLNFFGSQKRLPWWQKQMPHFCYIHSQRMSFTENGKTDSIEYCHLIYKQGEAPKFTKTRVI